MNRRLLGLLAAVCLTSACKEEAVGQMQPITPPPGTPAAPPKTAEAPKPAPEPPPDPSKVTLRWKLAQPAAFRLTEHATESAAPAAPAADAKGKKGGKAPSPTATAKPSDTTEMFVLYKTETGDAAVRIVPQGGGTPETGSLSERGFVLDGLPEPLRTTAVLALELPRDPVGPNSTWALGTNLLELSSVSDFVEQKAERHNEVKLASLTPGDNGEQVAVLDYDLSETHTGQMRANKPAPVPARPPKKAAPAPKKAAAGAVPVADEEAGEVEEAPTPARGMENASAEVRMKGHGEFLVKAGRWRSWQATLTTHITGAAIPGTTPGERTLSLTPVEPVPPELLPAPTKK